ncbi:CaiB/BaiF CoA-transferase family protein [Halioxenophilus sp. WMMB6]|uniref:CaiB/BaiF CoA transferase family protein n=1 Tax=Halioxenophilus sp. WMMB6 TaxID=3073815 RepID=UPI00295F01BA|nr:CaiB/BaiF CoA-transferase family protein [Halioxenophilus sp. WMMB6]
MTNNGPKPLQDLKVVEFTHMVMGPATGVILGDMGADVTKIEPLTGDNTRRLKGSGAGYFPMYNRNKKSLCVDLKSDEGKAVVLKLIAEADVLIENFRPGAMDKLGFGYETLKEINPRLIYCSLKGFLSGPYSHRTALDEVTQMMGGLAYMTGLPDRPMRSGSSVIDITGAMFGVIGILTAVHERHHTGVGKQVTASLYETTAFMVGQHMAQQAVSGVEPPPMSVRNSAWSIYDIFLAKGDEKVFVGVVSDTLWKKFCEEFGLTQFAEDRTLDANNERVKRRDEIIPVVQELFAAMDKQTLMARLDRAGVPFAPVNKPADLFDDPHLNEGGLLEVTLANEEKTKLPVLPLEFDGQRTGLYHDLPKEGEDTKAVLQAAGLDETAINQLINDRIVKAD